MSIRRGSTAAVLLLAASVAAAGRAPFTAATADPERAPAPIVVQHDPGTGTGFAWDPARPLAWHENTPARRAAEYLREGIRRMTGREPAIRHLNDLGQGLVLTTLAGASDAIRADPAIRAALAGTGEDAYNHVEAFYIRSEPERVLVVANTADGLLAAVVELLESVEYEVLGMGPNWTHVPDFRARPLVFDLEQAARPGYYIRSLWATSGQQRGVGTLTTVDDPGDEPVSDSYHRWLIGTRMAGRSMPPSPGHALQGYHTPVAAAMLAAGINEGFLAAACAIGPEANRPEPDPANDGLLWLAPDPAARGGVRAFLSDGKSWRDQNPHGFGVNLDLSVPLVRATILEAMKERSEKWFADNPESVFVFGTDPEDGGGYSAFAKRVRYPDWYPGYRTAAGTPLGAPYVLHGYNGLDQPVETWDPSTPCDTVFAFNNWLLREYDAWLETRPAGDRITTAGIPKGTLVRCSFYSYNFHDVPPNFNLDPRIRVMIAGYPKHRGRGKWTRFASQLDMARAFQVMLPREPSGDYRIISLAYYWDPGHGGIAPRWNASAAALAENYGSTFAAGIKAMSIETDFNFGRFGLAYYLIAKTLWNPALTGAELDAIRDRWFRRAFGSAWQEMKAYYDFMLRENYPVNGPNTWARAIRLIDAACRRLDPQTEPDARRRIDDVKQFWYYHYLALSGQAVKESPAMREFAWKGQMSYMTAMHMALRRAFETGNPREAAGPDYAKGPARYTHEETQAWWAKVLDFWPLTEVTLFGETSLADGRPAAEADLNDLVPVAEFRGGPADTPFLANSYDMPSIKVLTTASRAGEPIGFRISWPHMPEQGEAYVERNVAWGMERWNPAAREWEHIVDKTMIAIRSVAAVRHDGRAVQVAEARLEAPGPGVYRFDVGRAGRLASLTSLGHNLATGGYDETPGFTYSEVSGGLTQSPVFFYIPKSTGRLDFEVHDTHGGKVLVLHSGLPAAGMKETRRIDVSRLGTHTIDLAPEERGTVAMLRSNGFVYPFMYSLPPWWAKSPAALLVPRAIAEADGLTIVR